ncbi:unnamed protein product [Ectocarpus sp. 12 AP-2014]
MGMVVLRATSRLRFLPTHHETLDRHFNRLFPKDCQPWKSQAVEAFLVAHRNLYIAHEQRNKHRQEMASAALIFMRVMYLGMLAKTAELDDLILSPRVRPDQETFQHLPRVRTVLGAMLAADPWERINMSTVGLCLEHHGLWALGRQPGFKPQLQPTRQKWPRLRRLRQHCRPPVTRAARRAST